MSRAFTVYWTPEGWKGLAEGSRIRVAGGSGFLSKIAPGDRVYITNVMAGNLRLLGSFTVQQVRSASVDGKPPEATWDAPEYLMAEEASSSLFHIRLLPNELVRKLRFISERRPTVAFDSDDSVNGQAMRSVRELTPQSAGLLESVLQLSPKAHDNTRDRLPIEVLNKATAQHVWFAVQALLRGDVQHAFGESTDYDLITDDGRRLPPKAVFGVALTRALGWEVLPKHFTAGVGSPCFRLLNAAGYDIFLKGDPAPAREQPPPDDDEIDEWDEGGKKLVSHLKAERRRGLAKAKKADFRDRHNGKLFCERCATDPVVEYGTEHAESCIEVHHAATHVSEMPAGHKTRLEDLQCLCANCHRLLHRLLRVAKTSPATS
jgi:5-methylcytosine-specific restriction protein A